MVIQQLWNETDPEDARILVNTTKIEVLESDFNTTFVKHPRGRTGGGNTNPFAIPD